MPKKKSIYSWYCTTVVLLLILGLFLTGYLFYSHYQNYTDVTYASFCALSKSINCDTVSQSSWSILFGLPLALWGILAYILFSIFFFHTWQYPEKSGVLWYILFLLATLFSVFSVYLGYVSAAHIKAYCILCIATYFINLSLLLTSFLVINRFQRHGLVNGVGLAVKHILKSPFILLSLAFLIVGSISLQILIPSYWHFDYTNADNEFETGITVDGHPWIGSRNPQLVIHEYTDYQCFQCGKMHQFLRQLIAEYPDKIQLVHHNYPMDHTVNKIVVPEPFHVGSAEMAMLAIYATMKGDFLKMNDALYELGRNNDDFNTRILAEMTDFTSGELTQAISIPTIRERLRYEIRKGMKLRITGTPSYMINGVKYEGSIPLEILETVKQ